LSARPPGPAIALFLAFCTCAQAGPVVDRIKSAGVIRCGGVPRPGLVNRSATGAPSGLYLDLCRAVGAALLGPEGRIEFHPYDSDKAFAPTISSSSTDRTSPTIGSPAQ
jgi:ABC-type amino acid transport substrate-binding protein